MAQRHHKDPCKRRQQGQSRWQEVWPTRAWRERQGPGAREGRGPLEGGKARRRFLPGERDTPGETDLGLLISRTVR